MNQKLFSYIEACTTPYQAIAHTAGILRDAGYTHLNESDSWTLEAGKGYFVTRNGSSLIAFRVPDTIGGFMMTAAHCDSPCFKIKENAQLNGQNYVQLSVERYGGMLMATWMDKPLSVAGRVLVRTERGIETRFVDFKEPVALIPNLAIHMNRKANDGMTYNAAVDMLPLYSQDKEVSFRSRVAELAGVQEEALLTTDLFLYNPQKGYAWDNFVSAPRLDDLQCAFGSLEAFLSAEQAKNVPVYCLFDNEEVGSTTKQGAASTFLKDVLLRICAESGLSETDYRRCVANSFLISCDNAHAVHPNHPEYMDKNHAVYMNGGIVIKYNAGQKYTSDAVSAAIFQSVCDEAGVPFQRYANRADLMGGSTLGNIANTQVSLNTVDIGLAQLAMHSSFETAGGKDTEYMVRALKCFFEKRLIMTTDGSYTIE
ncbi:MAG: M18 family aminopeptidase [Ruminococcaceae bacterium]|nr:M18 family aminopeptidase [Oscillospiraceae bacterium]